MKSIMAVYILTILLLSSTIIHAKKSKKNKKRPGLGMVKLSGGSFRMGGDAKSGSPGTRDVQLRSYYIDRTSVTNQMWRQFVKETKYVSVAEKYKWSFVFDPLISQKIREKNPETVDSAKHWRAVGGAYWRRPEGPDGNTLLKRWNHPAVHISKSDAEAYCNHYKLRLPTEAEWEYAARGGLGLYPWGKNAMLKDKDGQMKWMMNVFQGASFPNEGVAEDGFLGVSPVDAYDASAYGIYGMLGNVWEWTSSQFKTQNPKERHFVLKGGSFVDSIDGEYNHKVTATTRMGNDLESGSINTGFRCVKGKGGGRRAPPSQEEMQRIIAEKGVAGLQEMLGDGHHVMKAKDLKERAAAREKLQNNVDGSDL